jgi:hypothetical protein
MAANLPRSGDDQPFAEIGIGPHPYPVAATRLPVEMGSFARVEVDPPGGDVAGKTVDAEIGGE